MQQYWISMKKLHWNVIFLAINGIIFRISEYIDVCVCVCIWAISLAIRKSEIY